MVLRKLTGVFSIALVLAAASAMAGVPDLQLSTASTAAGVGVTPVMYNLPNGLGATFAQARSTGGVVNATITLTVLDGGGVPVANFSASDMWLEKEIVAGTGNFNACTGGTTADLNTSALGVTTWAAPLRAGGWSTSKTLVVINGAALTSNTGLILRHNSADINGDGNANLSDIPLFATDFQAGANAFRSDLQFDGFVNLSDIPRLASGVGAVCP
ncbi:MAG: hypothetical protein Q8N51_02440 [Gammaproteobacteria bacterium]|jgi:hypothetical protein|nr:hypothetical protein [Gammaproteobacteria bacterium]